MHVGLHDHPLSHVSGTNADHDERDIDIHLQHAAYSRTLATVPLHRNLLLQGAMRLPNEAQCQSYQV